MFCSPKKANSLHLDRYWDVMQDGFSAVIKTHRPHLSHTTFRYMLVKNTVASLISIEILEVVLFYSATSGKRKIMCQHATKSDVFVLNIFTRSILL